MAEQEPKGSFVRWQSLSIGQLTYAVNLVLGLAVAALGFQAALLLNKDFSPAGWQKCAYAAAMFLLTMSIVLGVLVVVNRLRDFRATKDAARLREEGAANSLIEPHRFLYRKLGRRTWGLFWWQVATFAIGVVLTAVALLGVAGHKLL